MKSGRLETLGPGHAAAAYRFCEARPERCAFLAGWIHEGGLSEDPRVPRGWLLAERRGGAIQGLVYVSETGIVLPADLGPQGLDEVAKLSRRNPNAVRVIVAELGQAASLWSRLQRQGASARIIRDQLGYMVQRTDFAPAGDLDLIVASDGHLDRVVAVSAAMAREEARDDPQGRNPALFRQRIRERIARGRDFIHLADERLLFKSNISALSPVAGQVEGIYTLPAARRRGIGARGTSSVTRWILDHAARAFLLVNDDNEPAKRLYERLGYQRVLRSRTIFVAP